MLSAGSRCVFRVLPVPAFAKSCHGPAVVIVGDIASRAARYAGPPSSKHIRPRVVSILTALMLLAPISGLPEHYSLDRCLNTARGHARSSVDPSARRGRRLKGGGGAPPREPVRRRRPGRNLFSFRRFGSNLSRVDAERESGSRMIFRAPHELRGRCLPMLLAFALACGWLAPPALALDPRKAMSQYVHDVWTTNNGLPQDSVNAIVQTTDGYLWIARRRRRSDPAGRLGRPHDCSPSRDHPFHPRESTTPRHRRDRSPR